MRSQAPLARNVNMQRTTRSTKPVKLKARLSMAAFILVAAASLTLTSVGLLHVASQTVPAAPATSASTALGIEVIR